MRVRVSLLSPGVRLQDGLAVPPLPPPVTTTVIDLIRLYQAVCSNSVESYMFIFALLCATITNNNICCKHISNLDTTKSKTGYLHESLDSCGKLVAQINGFGLRLCHECIPPPYMPSSSART